MSILWKACEIALHDLIAERLYPAGNFNLGTGEIYSFRDAEISFKRVGNRTGVPRGALSFLYTINGRGFKAVIRVVIVDGDLDVRLRDIYPDTDEALISLNDWLNPSQP